MELLIYHDERINKAIKQSETGVTYETRTRTLHYEESMFDASFYTLLKAYENRTRQYNFFKLYTDYLDGTITEEEFNQEIDQNEDKYVIPEPQDASPAQVELAYRVSEKIKDFGSTEDFTSLFSISDKSLSNAIAQ